MIRKYLSWDLRKEPNPTSEAKATMIKHLINMCSTKRFDSRQEAISYLENLSDWKLVKTYQSIKFEKHHTGLCLGGTI